MGSMPHHAGVGKKDKTKLQVPSRYCPHKVNPIAKYTPKAFLVPIFQYILLWYELEWSI
jgi:hypothetical protein